MPTIKVINPATSNAIVLPVKEAYAIPAGDDHFLQMSVVRVDDMPPSWPGFGDAITAGANEYHFHPDEIEEFNE